MRKNIAVFAGQGAQFVGMGRDLCEAFPECGKIFNEADQELGFDISKICFDGPESELTRSSNCQPAIFVMSVACFTAFEKAIGNPFGATAGLSLGEWTALHVAGAIGFRDAVRVLEARGRFMQEACDRTDGGMASVIGLAREKVEEVCAKTGVQMANLNSGEQIVLSGEKRLVAEAERLAIEAGAKKTVMLNVAGAYHSKLMDTAAERLDGFLRDIEIKTPGITVLSNVTGLPHGTPDEIRKLMVKQVNSPVRWLSCVEWFVKNGADRYVEFGPGRVLSGLIKRIHKGSALLNVQDKTSLDSAVQAMKG